MEQRFDRFYRYTDLTAILDGFARRHPQLFSVQSIGKSYEGRDIWPEMTADRGQSEWTLRATAGSRVTVSARHERAGRVSVVLTLE